MAWDGPAPLIWRAAGARDMRIARTMFEEYQASIGVDLCFQNFAQELATLPGAYAPPRGRLLLAGSTRSPLGCVALRPLPRPATAGSIGEVKRLYVRPQTRGTGLGRSLVETLLADARAIGYRELSSTHSAR